MCNYTEEGDTNGLGIFHTDVKRFSNKVKVPQMGWNTVKNLKSDVFKNIDEGDYMYLVHSYYAENCKESIATSDYEIEYASALENDNFFGVQFHPEKSGKAGARLLQNFLEL
jgi:glutamine amidotransferase